MELRNQKKKKKFFIAWYYKLITFGFAQLKKNTIANNREIYLKKKKGKLSSSEVRTWRNLILTKEDLSFSNTDTINTVNCKVVAKHFLMLSYAAISWEGITLQRKTTKKQICCVWQYAWCIWLNKAKFEFFFLIICIEYLHCT